MALNGDNSIRRPAAARRAFGVHLFTAAGAGVALIALVEAVRGNFAAMFFWLGIALLIDGIDGTLARRYDVSAVLPNWSGDVLDLVIDYVTYVFVPAYAIAASGLVPAAFALPLGAAVAVSGALYFADRRMKTDDFHFRGFPALWNVAAFYLFLIAPPPWLAAVSVVALVVMTFIPVHVIHPLRVVRWRRLNIVVMAVWGLLAGFVVLQGFNVSNWIVTALSVLGIYVLAADGLARLVRRMSP